jgi:hypothetical protein
MQTLKNRVVRIFEPSWVQLFIYHSRELLKLIEVLIVNYKSLILNEAPALH